MSDSRAFFDSNALVYLYSVDEPLKQRQALSALLTYDCVISRQVINEFCNVNLKKKKMLTGRLKDVIENVRYLFPLVPIDDNTVFSAITIHERYRYSYYDSLIIAAAIASGSEYLFSEDMQDGQVIDGLTIVNIFTPSAPSGGFIGGGGTT
jgi:predicted nucleic acid-binding protein